MLIWIKGPCVAVGVLAAFVLLLSSVTSEEVSIDGAADNLDLPTETPVTDETDERVLMDLPFADKLRNTCDLQNDRTSPVSISGEHRTHFQLEFLNHVLVYVNFTKRSALQVLQNLSINNCSSLHMNNLPHTPTLEELKEMDIKGALNKIYSSLLVHSGYSYFISYQILSTDTRCSEDINREQALSEVTRDLAEKQRFLACRLQLGMKMLGYKLDDAYSVLNETVTDVSQCSLRYLRDCQVIKSINNFLQIFNEYVTDYVRGFTQSLTHNLRTLP